MKSLIPLLAALCGLLFLSAASSGGDDELVKEFKKYFKKYKDVPTRVEAILALDGEESTAVVDALLPVLRDEAPEVVRAAVQVLSSFETAKPQRRLLAEFEATKDEAQRIGILRALALCSYPMNPETFYGCLSDRSWEVRRRGVGAIVSAVLGPPYVPTQEELDKPPRRPRDWPASPDAALAPLTGDAEVAVRCATLEGLAAIDSGLVTAPAVAALDDPTWQVRASAIQALTKVRRQDGIGPLVARMQVEEGRLVADIGEALGTLTCRNFGQRREGWLEFWDTFGDRFVMPSDEERARYLEAKAKSAAFYNPPGSVSYHGVQTPSRSILFVIDVSGSMENEVIERERFEDGDYPSFSRIDIVKTELQRTIEGLEDYVRFNVMSFATDVDQWKKGLVTANVLNKSSAIDWVGKLDAIGGGSKSELAEVGLVGSANLEAGKTNTYAALMTALGAAGTGVRDAEYEVEVDTIFFLSDGRPSTGEYVDTQDILREVLAANELRKVVLHTIAIGEFQKGFMKQLAERSGGVFVDLGR